MRVIQQFFTWLSGTFKKQNRTGKIAMGCISLFMLCCICSVPIALLSPSNSTAETTKNIVEEVVPSPTVEPLIPTGTKVVKMEPSATHEVVIIPTETFAPTLAPTETFVPTTAPSNTPVSTATAETVALLPGLMPADVTVNLEQRGFTCGSPEHGELYYLRTCTQDSIDYSLYVEIYGREPFSVDMIDSSALQFANPTTEFAAEFLGFMATMPYDGAVQQEARNWVETTVPLLKGQGDIREKTFSGVTYRLFGIPTAYTLEMGDLP